MVRIDEREIEQGYARFHRTLNRILRTRDVRRFKAHLAAHPLQAGKLSHCLGLSDELAEIEMVKAIMLRSALKDIHPEAEAWLRARGIEPPRPKRRNREKRKGRRGRHR